MVFNNITHMVRTNGFLTRLQDQETNFWALTFRGSASIKLYVDAGYVP